MCVGSCSFVWGVDLVGLFEVDLVGLCVVDIVKTLGSRTKTKFGSLA